MIMVNIQNSFWQKEIIPSVPFSPSDLANLNQWYEPAYITSSNVVNWNDSSGQNHYLQRVIGTVTTSSLNGHKTVVIDNTTAMIAFNNYTTVFNQPNQTIFVVVKPTYGTQFGDYGSVANKINVFNVDGQSGNTMRYFVRDTSGNVIQRTDISIPNGKSGFNIYCLMVDGTNKQIFAFDHTGSLYTASNASYASDTTWEGLWNTVAYQTWHGLGTYTYNQSTGYGEYAEIIIYQETKSLADINKLGNYLSDKYNLSWTDF